MANSLLQGFDKYKKTYSPGDILFQEGDSGDTFYIVQKGLVEISKETEDEETVIATIGPGEVIGEMAMAGEPSERSATARSQTETACLQFSKKQFDHLMEQSSEFRNRVLSILCTRLRKTSENLSALEKDNSILYKSALFFIGIIDKNRWYGAGSKNMILDPDIKKATSQFEVSEKSLELLLGTVSSEEFSSLKPEYRQRAMETVNKILETGLEKFHFTSPYGIDVFEDDTDFMKLNVEMAADHAKKLYLSIKERKTSLTKSQYEKIKTSYDRLNEIYVKNETDPTVNQADCGQLDAYLHALQRVMRSKKPD
jgi:CRP-like cAMP-binding protein